MKDQLYEHRRRDVPRLSPSGEPLTVALMETLRGARPDWRRPIVLALVTLGLGVACSTLLALAQARRNDRLAQRTFDTVAERLSTQLQTRLGIYKYGLRGARGAAVAAGIERLDRGRFRSYSLTRDLDLEFPGARGIGIIRRVAEGDETRFLDAARSDGMPTLTIRQLSSHSGDRYVIQYIEPMERNGPAVGLDVASEANRREAAEVSMRTGRATLTAPITILQATEKALRSFLLMLPIYQPGADLGTADSRAAATVGWSYAALVMDDVLADLYTGGEFTLALRDVDAGGTGDFFTTREHERPPAGGVSSRLRVPVCGRTWEAELKATPRFVAGLNLVTPIQVMGIGLGISVLLSILSLLSVRSRQRESQIKTEQARRSAIVASSGDAIVGATLDGFVTDWNPAAERIFGYPAALAIGRPVATLLLPPGRKGEDAALLASAAHGEIVPIFDSTRLCADGRLLDVSVSVAPILDRSGRCVGVSKTLRDISATRRAADDIERLNASLELQVQERTQRLHAAERDLRNILDAVPSLVSYWDRDLRNRFANRAYLDWLGLDPGRMPGVHLREVVGERFESARPRFAAALRGETVVFETELATTDGGTRHVVAHYLPDVAAGQVNGFYLIVYDVTAQTRAQQALASALRDNQALLGTVNEHAIVSVSDDAGRIIDVNQRFCEISGYAREELLGYTHRIVNSGVHAKSFWVEVWRAIAAGRSWRGEVCNRRKDGSLYWVDTMITPITDRHGKIERYISIRVDITAAKENEQNLQQARDRIAMAADAAGIGIWEWDIVGNVLRWDDWMYRIYGRLAAEHEQPYAVWSTSLHPDDRERSERELNAAVAGEQPFDTEFRIVTPSGNVRHLKASARVVRDASGGALRMTGVNFDITERKRAEIELSATSSLLSKVLESASEVAIIAGDPALNITIFNTGAERLTGYRSDEVVNRATPGLFHDPAEVEQRARELTELAGQPVIGGGAFIHPLALGRAREWTYVRKDGARVTVALVVTAMYGANGEVSGYLGIAHDVTRQKEYEATLRAARIAAEEASLSKSRFLANISHEIRTPMNAVVGLSYLLGRTPLDSKQAELLNKVHVASKSLLGLLNDVLDVSKIEAGELRIERVAFDLRHCLKEICEIAEVQASGKGIGFASELPRELPVWVEGDVVRLGQILSNLVSNAIKFTERGRVTLRVAELQRANDRVTLRFEVVDTGIGIPAEVQGQLFVPFMQGDASTTRRFGGTGLGLSIVKHLTQLMDGEVGLASAPGAGSTFWFVLAFDLSQRSAVAIPAQVVPTTTNALRGLRVLVADDSEMNLFVARSILAQEGAHVTVAHNGQEAIDRLRASDRIDVVLMDVQMPVMDGYTATDVMRASPEFQSLPVIALTADARASERERALAAGMTDFLSKPFEPAQLIRCILRAVPTWSPVAPTGATGAGEPSVPSPDAWPEIDGIDTAAVRRLLAEDRALFQTLLRYLVEEISNLRPFGERGDELAVAAYAARMHRLRGVAGQMAAGAISELAGRIEQGFREGRPEHFAALTEQLCREVERLCSSAKAVLGTTPVVVSLPSPSSGPELQRLSALLDQLRQHDLAALNDVGQVSSWVAGAWDPHALQTLLAHIENLRFREAAELLERQLAPDVAA